MEKIGFREKINQVLEEMRFKPQNINMHQKRLYYYQIKQIKEAILKAINEAIGENMKYDYQGTNNANSEVTGYNQRGKELRTKLGLEK